jgi:hypothetical protein
MQFSLIAAIAALAATTAAAPHSSNCFSNTACAKPAMKGLCEEAYKKFDDDTVYGKGAMKKASNGNLVCEAYLQCDSSLTTPKGGIKWDRISGYDMKFQYVPEFDLPEPNPLLIRISDSTIS